LRRHVDSLGPDVHAIEVSQDGELVKVSSKPNDDETRYPFFPLLQDLQKSNKKLSNTKKPGIRKPRTQKSRIQRPRVQTVLRAELCELDRLGPEVDLALYRSQKVVFKYYFWARRLIYLWNELNISAHLPPHPNIVPFHRVVVEKLQGQEHIVGFTTRYIAGGTLAALAEGRYVFKLKWLK
jgi:hypothetical protein